MLLKGQTLLMSRHTTRILQRCRASQLQRALFLRSEEKRCGSTIVNVLTFQDFYNLVIF